MLSLSTPSLPSIRARKLMLAVVIHVYCPYIYLANAKVVAQSCVDLSPFHINFVSLLIFIISLPLLVTDRKRESSILRNRKLFIHYPALKYLTVSDGEKSSIFRVITRTDKSVVVRINPEIAWDHRRKRRRQFSKFKDLQMRDNLSLNCKILHSGTTHESPSSMRWNLFDRHLATRACDLFELLPVFLRNSRDTTPSIRHSEEDYCLLRNCKLRFVDIVVSLVPLDFVWKSKSHLDSFN